MRKFPKKSIADGGNVDVKYAVATGDLEYTSTGTVSKDKTVNGAGLSVRIDQGGKPTEYAAGLSMLGGSEAVYNVEGKGYEAFRAYVSLSFDNGQDAEGAVSFEVYVDDEKTARYRSGVMTHATKNLALDVDIKGAKIVKLVTKTEDSSVDNSKNIGNWCDTKFVSSNVAVKSAKLKEKDFYYADGTKHSRGKVKGLEGEWKERSRKHRYVMIFDKSLKLLWEK